MRPSTRCLLHAMAVVLAVAGGPGCSGGADDRGGRTPHLVLIVVDNLRADRVGAYGYDRPTTPVLDDLARGGLLFEHAFAPASWTRPSVASLFTSRWPSEHGAVDFERGMAASLPTVAERIQAAGYRTVGLTANFVHVREDLGFARGFSSWKTSSERTEPEAPDALWGGFEQGAPTFRSTPGRHLTQQALELVAEDLSRPLFLYVHYMDPHVPWTADPEAWRRVAGRERESPRPVTSAEVVELAARRAVLDAVQRQRLLDAYDAAVAAADSAIGELLEGLARLGVCGGCVVVVTSDHGEEFGEHGGWFHGSTLYQEVIAVPLIVHDVRRAPRALRSEVPVDLLDVAPTLLSLAGVGPEPDMRGRDLLGERLPARDLVAELHRDEHFAKVVGPPAHRLALVRWPWKLLREPDGNLYVYRLDRDAREADRLDPGAAPAVLASVDGVEAAIEQVALPDAQRDGIPPESVDALRALGYAR